MTGNHKCPHCKKSFEYSPNDYHRQISCGSPKCRPFGFMLYHVSDRTMKQLKEDIQAEQTRIAKAREQKQRRAARQSRSLSAEEEERAFLMGLVDCCPRCGEVFEGYPDEESQRQHLTDCMDDKKHAEHQSKKAEKRKIEESKLAKQNAQEMAQSKAQWDFLGGKTSQLWLLDESQLRVQASDAGLSVKGSKEDLIARIAVSRYSSDTSGEESNTLLRISEGTTSCSTALICSDGRGLKKRRRLTADSVPSNFHSFPVAQLRALCASHGFLPTGIDSF